MKFRYMVVVYDPLPDGKFNEYTKFVDKLKGKNKSSASVILDFKKKEVLKNKLNPNATFNDMLGFYKKALGDSLTPYL